jgi:transposase-like protein
VSDDTGQPNRMGRPPTYKPEMCEQVRKLCEMGAKDIEIANFFGVATGTIYRWRNEHPEFREASKLGKDAFDDRIERSLAEKATGYSFESEKVFQHGGEIIRAKVIEHVPPSDTAMIYWLKNRRPDVWRDKHEVEVAAGDLMDVLQQRLKQAKSGDSSDS